MVDIFRIPAFKDNYLWVIHSGGETAVIDPGDAEEVIKFLNQKGWALNYIWNTHHHFDHVGGNLELKRRYRCKIVGSVADQDRIPGLDHSVDDGDIVRFGLTAATVHFTPGHTRGHICFRFIKEKIAFVGDTLFGMGCGRLFEGTPEAMWKSLKMIRSWPGDTEIYCAHEYTESNARFALAIEPENQVIRKRLEQVIKLRQENHPTIPFKLSEDINTNPFLRADDPNLKRAINLQDASDIQAFARIRNWKDTF